MRITFKTAELAKQKGFDLRSSNCWVKTLSGEIIHNSERQDIHEHERCSYYLSQPTQSELQKWLRDKHRIYVDAFFNSDSINSTQIQIIRQITFPDNVGTTYIVWKKVWENRFALNDDKYQFNLKMYTGNESYKVKTFTYEEGLEEGLFEGLKLI